MEAQEIWQAFQNEYLEADEPVRFIDYAIASAAGDSSRMDGVLTIARDGVEMRLAGTGNGPMTRSRMPSARRVSLTSR